MNRQPMYASEFPPYIPGTPWASSPMPPNFQQAQARFPHSDLLTSSIPYRLVCFDGAVNDWWNESDERFEAVFVMHIMGAKGGGLLLEGVALDDEFTQYAWGRCEGRWIFWTTKDWVVALAFANEQYHINMSEKLKPLHKTFFAKWPSVAQIEALLSSP